MAGPSFLGDVGPGLRFLASSTGGRRALAISDPVWSSTRESVDDGRLSAARWSVPLFGFATMPAGRSLPKDVVGSFSPAGRGPFYQDAVDAARSARCTLVDAIPLDARFSGAVSVDVVYVLVRAAIFRLAAQVCRRITYATLLGRVPSGRIGFAPPVCGFWVLAHVHPSCAVQFGSRTLEGSVRDVPSTAQSGPSS